MLGSSSFTATTADKLCGLLSTLRPLVIDAPAGTSQDSSVGQVHPLQHGSLGRRAEPLLYPHLPEEQNQRFLGVLAPGF